MRLRLGRDGHLKDAIALMPEQVIDLFDLIHFESMRDERTQINTAGAYHLHQPTHALLSVRTKRGDDLVVPQSRGEGVHRDPQITRIHAEARRRAAGP